MCYIDFIHTFIIQNVHLLKTHSFSIDSFIHLFSCRISFVHSFVCLSSFILSSHLPLFPPSFPPSFLPPSLPSFLPSFIPPFLPSFLPSILGWVGLWGFLWWAPSAKRKDHHGVSSGWSSIWHRSNTDLSSTQYEQIPIIFGVWPFWLTPFFFRSITFWRAYGWIVFPLLKLLSFFWLTYHCSIGLCFSARV